MSTSSLRNLAKIIKKKKKSRLKPRQWTRCMVQEGKTGGNIQIRNIFSIRKFHIYSKRNVVSKMLSGHYTYQWLNGALFLRQVHCSVRTADPPDSDRQL